MQTLHAKWLFIHSILSSVSNLLAMEHNFRLFVGWLQHNGRPDCFKEEYTINKTTHWNYEKLSRIFFFHFQSRKKSAFYMGVFL